MPLDFRLCQKCPQGEYEEPEYGEDGTINRYPSVTCQVAHGAVLLVDDEIPKGCLYVLEHKVMTQDLSTRVIRRLSGKGEPDEAEL